MEPEEIAKELRKLVALGGIDNKPLEHEDFILLHSAANLIEKLVAEAVEPFPENPTLSDRVHVCENAITDLQREMNKQFPALIGE